MCGPGQTRNEQRALLRPHPILARWIIGAALGALFVWLATRDWPWALILGAPLHFEGAHIVGGKLGTASPSSIVSGRSPLPEGAWHCDLVGMIPYLFTLVAIHFLRVIRWIPLLRAMDHQVPFKVLNATGGISFAAIFLFPLRLGELARPVLLAKLSEVKVSESMALVVVERIFDGLAVTLMLAAVLLWMPMDHAEAYFRIQTGATIAFIFFSVGLGGILLTYFFRERMDAALELVFQGRFHSMGRKIRGILTRFYGGLACLPNLKVMLIFTGLTLVYWLINGWGHYTMVRAFGFSVDPLVGFAMMASVAIGMMIPNSPANVGTFWYFLLLPLQIYGISDSTAQAVVFALFLWASQMGQMVIFGLYFLGKTPISLREVTATREHNP